MWVGLIDDNLFDMWLKIKQVLEILSIGTLASALSWGGFVHALSYADGGSARIMEWMR